MGAALVLCSSCTVTGVKPRSLRGRFTGHNYTFVHLHPEIMQASANAVSGLEVVAIRPAV